jgi:hypothetical protein
MGEDDWEPIEVFMTTSFFRRRQRKLSERDWEDQNINKSPDEPIGVVRELERNKALVKELHEKIRNLLARNDRLLNELHEARQDEGAYREFRRITNSTPWRLGVGPAVKALRRLRSLLRLR